LNLSGAAFFLAESLATTAQGDQEYLPDTVIADFYRLADALILPSREEGFGIPLLEAGLAGLPVFCSAIPPLQALGEEQAHYFSPDAHPDQVASQMTEVLGASPVFALRRRVRRQYTWEQIYTRQIAPLLTGAAAP
jgi:glycosyltransferase involved in cell wall biosynthesis